MVYRAKVTSIFQWVKENIDMKKYHFLRDKLDIYIEVSSPDTADEIEELNDLYEKQRKLEQIITETLNNIEIWK